LERALVVPQLKSPPTAAITTSEKIAVFFNDKGLGEEVTASEDYIVARATLRTGHEPAGFTGTGRWIFAYCGAQ
jgi:hypothetical protein